MYATIVLSRPLFVPIVSDSTQVFSFKKLARDQLVAVGMLLGFAVYTVWDQFFWWGAREDYSFGYLVPFFAIYVIYDRWPVIRSYLLRGEAPEVVAAPAAPVATGLTQLFEWLPRRIESFRDRCVTALGHRAAKSSFVGDCCWLRWLTAQCGLYYDEGAGRWSVAVVEEPLDVDWIIFISCPDLADFSADGVGG